MATQSIPRGSNCKSGQRRVMSDSHANKYESWICLCKYFYRTTLLFFLELYARTQMFMQTNINLINPHQRASQQHLLQPAMPNSTKPRTPFPIRTYHHLRYDRCFRPNCRSRNILDSEISAPNRQPDRIYTHVGLIVGHHG